MQSHQVSLYGIPTCPLKFYRADAEGQHVVHWMNKEGSGCSSPLCLDAMKLWTWGQPNTGWTPMAFPLRGGSNDLAEFLSRQSMIDHKWFLQRSIIELIFHCWGVPMIDQLFQIHWVIAWHLTSAVVSRPPLHLIFPLILYPPQRDFQNQERQSHSHSHHSSCKPRQFWMTYLLQMSIHLWFSSEMSKFWCCSTTVRYSIQTQSLCPWWPGCSLVMYRDCSKHIPEILIQTWKTCFSTKEPWLCCISNILSFNSIKVLLAVISASIHLYSHVPSSVTQSCQSSSRAFYLLTHRQRTYSCLGPQHHLLKPYRGFPMSLQKAPYFIPPGRQS